MNEKEGQQALPDDTSDAFAVDFVPPKGELRLGSEGPDAAVIDGVTGISMQINSAGTGECGYCSVHTALWMGLRGGEPVYLCRACFHQQYFAQADVTNLSPDDFIDIVNDDR